MNLENFMNNRGMEQKLKVSSLMNFGVRSESMTVDQERSANPFKKQGNGPTERQPIVFDLGTENNPGRPMAHKIASQQWRLKSENIVFNRPKGMPPIIPKESKSAWDEYLSYQRNHFRNLPHREGNKFNVKRPYGRNRQFDIGFQQQQQANNNGKIMKQVAATFKAALPPQSKYARLDARQAFNNNGSGGIFDQFVQNNSQERSNVQKHVPKYNMDVQKEISDLQKRPFAYTSANDGKPAIVSFDGPGLDLAIIPHATKLTMNFRFSG